MLETCFRLVLLCRLGLLFLPLLLLFFSFFLFSILTFFVGVTIPLILFYYAVPMSCTNVLTGFPFRCTLHGRVLIVNACFAMKSLPNKRLTDGNSLFTTRKLPCNASLAICMVVLTIPSTSMGAPPTPRRLLSACAGASTSPLSWTSLLSMS